MKLHMAFEKEIAKKYLKNRELREREEDEKIRLELFRSAVRLIEEELIGKEVQAYLIGSVIIPYKFSKHSDIDIVLKNFTGDRFDLATKWEGILERGVEVIMYENCLFQKHVETEGFKVI